MDRYSKDPYQIDDSRDIFLDIQTWKMYFAEEVKLSTRYLQVGGNELLLIKSEPKEQSNLAPVLFIPGWFSVISSWMIMLKELSSKTIIYYLETREKSSAQLSSDPEFSIETLAEDFNEIVDQLEDQLENMICLSSSMGGTLMINYLARFSRFPKKTVFIGPNPRIKVPPIIGQIILHLPLFMFRIAIAYARWHIIKFRLDPEKDPDQVKKYLQVLRLAIPWRLRKSAQAVVKYDGWKDLQQIEASCIFAGASGDKLHAAELTLKMQSMIEDSQYIEFSTNKEVHSEKMAEVVLGLCAQE